MAVVPRVGRGQAAVPMRARVEETMGVNYGCQDTRGESSTRKGNLGQRFSLWLCFHCSRAHAPCSVSLSSSGMLSSKIRILRKGSQSQNPFVPQDVAWRGDRRAPVGTYC